MEFSIGCDPELFVADENGPRSIIGKIGGTKLESLPMPIGDGFAVQEDNVALEFNIPASRSKAEFVGNIYKAVNFLEGVVKQGYGFHFDRRSAISFPETELDDPAAFVFGCDPDFDAWTGGVNPSPAAEDKFLRSAGGHVHIGFDVDAVDRAKVIRCCDLRLGVASVLMDSGELRKQLYGKRGAYRPKPFGAEYRTLSNFWVFDEKLVGWVYDNVARALVDAQAGLPVEEDDKLIAQAINGNDKSAALQLVNKYQLEVL